MSSNPAESQINLDQLAAEIRAECAAANEASQCHLDHAIAAGKRLLQAKECIDRGFRQWLKQHGLNKTDCYDFMLLARHEESVRNSGHSSVAAALRMLRGKSGGKTSNSKRKPKSPLTKAIWTAASVEERRRFLDSIGVGSFCEALSSAFRAKLRRRVGGQRAAMSCALGDTLAAAFRQALSLQKSAKSKDTPAIGVVHGVEGGRDAP